MIRTALFLAGLLGALLVTPAAHAADPSPYPIAHRGYSAGVVENTPRALYQAAQYGAQHVEVDLRLTEDRKMVVMHDAGLARTTTCTGLVVDRTKAWIRENCLTEDGQEVPFAIHILDRSLDYGLDLVLEIKADSQNRWDAEAFRDLRDLIESRGMAGRVRLLSFEIGPLALAEDLFPGFWPTTRIATLDDPPTSNRGADSVAVLAEHLSPEVAALPGRLFARNTNDPEEWELFRDYGAAGVLTDDVPGYLDWWRADTLRRVAQG